ncbi:hypothetical protein Leryth_001730 [Lithospermum erythrorhizon]|nr:hypothetical protein Leryth_001730 [Lithospermum erythrorhizon]
MEKTIVTLLSLNWNTLFKIAIGAAQPNVHLTQHKNHASRYQTPHNILLSDDFCPKISDFGLDKLSETKESIFSKCSARGTIGYIAPELVLETLESPTLTFISICMRSSTLDESKLSQNSLSFFLPPYLFAYVIT